MCGIAGIFDRDARHSPDERIAIVERMTATLRHRGPDGGGSWSDADASIALGHRRLSIIDLSQAGTQPMTSTCGRCTISFNGEIYNFATIRQGLREAGRSISGASDTATLVEACALWGIEATLARCVGMFAFALFDREKRTLTLARDRLGIKPLFWMRTGETVAFGSELKPLMASGLLERTLDPAALAAYMNVAYVPAPRTIYAGVAKLPPGHVLVIPAHGEPQLRCFWDAAAIAESGQSAAAACRIDPAESQHRIEELLATAVSDRLVSDVPIGALLSGGIDSSAIVALMQQAASGPVKTFSIGFSEAGYDESASAAAVARHLGTDHTGLTVTPEDALATIPDLAAIYDEPFADSSQIPTILLSRLTRRHVTVALSGDGGDEVFAGYNRYRYLPGVWRRAGWLPAPLRRAGASAMTLLSPALWDELARLAPTRSRPRQFGDKVWKTAGALAAPDFDAAYATLLGPWPSGTRLVPGLTAALPVNAGRLTDPLARMQLADTLAFLPDDILTKVDRASMAASLEVRVPLLDHRLFEYVWQLPRDHLTRGGSKTPLRLLLDRYVPRELVDRPKAGFAVPIDSWLRGPLRDWAESLLSPAALTQDGLLDPVPVRAAWDQHLSGRRNNQHALWIVLMFQAWRRQWMDAP